MVGMLYLNYQYINSFFLFHPMSLCLYTNTICLTHTYLSILCSVGTLACLNSTLPSLFLQVCVSERKREYEGGANWMSAVCVSECCCTRCVCFCVSPYGLISGSVAVVACSGAWFRLQLAHLISCRCFTSLSLTPSPPPSSQPTFPTTFFPTAFSRLSRACPLAYREHDSLRTGGEERRGKEKAAERCEQL